MIGTEGIASRVDRLGHLSRGLAREAALWNAGESVLLHCKRKEYLRGVLDALAGLDAARVTLERAMGRMGSREGPRLMG